MAYDSAAIKLRDPETHRNFPWTEISIQEPKFQSQFSTSAVLNMIKEGSYNCQFSDYLKAQTQQRLNFSIARGNNGIKMRQLFQKELTPNDGDEVDDGAGEDEDMEENVGNFSNGEEKSVLLFGVRNS